MRNLTLLTLVVLLTGCAAVGPDYVKPEMEIPQDWRIDSTNASQIANTAWWRIFDDPVLDQLVQQALEHNHDVRIAAARVEEFAARVDIDRSGFYPQIGYGGTAATGQASRNSFGGVPSGTSRGYDDYQVGVNLGWELDFWGRLRRATEASRAELLAMEEGRRTVILTLVSAVAGGYVSLRGLDRQLEIAGDTLEKRAESVGLFETQFEGGVVSELEVAQIQSEYEAAAVVVPAIERQIALLENSLSILLGSNPAAIPRGKTIEQLILPEIPAGIPSQVLERRPDLRQAEQVLIAANARIGVARAHYYPTISLTGMLGYASADLSALLDGSSGIWSLGGSLLGPVFAGGRLDAQLRVAESIQEQALHQYIAAVQTAFREVDDALVTTRKTGEELAARGRQVAALQEYSRHAHTRYDEGYVSYIEVLDADRRLFEAELEETRKQGELYAALISVYKAMGGGWVTIAEATANEVDYVPAPEHGEGTAPGYPGPTLPAAQSGAAVQ